MDEVTKKLVFLDTETTGTGEKDRLVQVAYTIGTETKVNKLFKPELPIKIEAMAVCHITNKMVEDKERFKGSDTWQELLDLLADKDTVLVAHNAKFDIAMLNKEGLEVKNHICTYKIAHHLDKEGVIPKYNLQYLRYLLDLDADDATAHDAMGDVVVLEKLFERLLDKMFKETDTEVPFATNDDAIEGMIEVSSKPILFKKFSFGKHEGEKVEDVVKTKEGKGYLQWLLKSKEESEKDEEDWIYTLSHYLF